MIGHRHHSVYGGWLIECSRRFSTSSSRPKTQVDVMLVKGYSYDHCLGGVHCASLFRFAPGGQCSALAVSRNACTVRPVAGF
ncbi:unnamed protein product [Macrosiphum euphorbiae]|uniref:Uncharacterized protein n=1 Tax=Macrosiphum euphorbiae TaxID=13131 RepID=A0AAV0XU37_9HEMI|nr:unnamed protein product [Macrosiphum euphorbiae]